MTNVISLSERRTSVDEIFDHLRTQIEALQLKPGEKISEAEIAARFGVSRQPVRDAFNRLANIDLLIIRPQRATKVRRFSKRSIEKARFIRLSIEKEVLGRAARFCTSQDGKILHAALKEQDKTVISDDFNAFKALDYDFHKLICQVGQCDYAYEVICEQKAKIDRLCILAQKMNQRLSDLVSDHRAIAEAVICNDAGSAIKTGIMHLSRLDEVIKLIELNNANYFEESSN